MANLQEQSAWEAGIYQLEETDPVQGGPEGIDNRQAKQLANRTQFLKSSLESLQGGLSGHTSAPDPHPQYTTDSEVDAKIAAAVNALLNGTGSALDTLKELADALGNDANFAATVNAAIAARLTQAQGDARYVLLANIAAYAQLGAVQSWTKAQRAAEVALPVTAGTVTLDMSLSNNFAGTPTGNITFANPTNMAVGQSGLIRVVWGSTPYSWAFGSVWKFPGGVIPTATATAGAEDILAYYVESSSRIATQVISDVK